MTPESKTRTDTAGRARPRAPRKTRRAWDEPGHAHFLTYSCYRRWPLLSKDRTRRWVTEAMEHARLDRLTVRYPSRSVFRFWQPGGGYDRNMWQAKRLAEVIEHVHASPVRRGLVERPEDWYWSSAPFWAGRHDVPLAMDPIDR